MKITLEPTATLSTIRQGENSVRAREWQGTSDKGVKVVAWIALLGAASDGDQVDFQRELRQVEVERTTDCVVTRTVI